MINSSINNSKPLLIGHRGAAGLAPENTLSAIRKALDLRVDRIEIDIQQTKDKVLIAMHDRTLDRTTNGKGLIKNYRYPTIAKLSIKSVLIPPHLSEPIPRLEEILELIAGKATLLIDVKYGNSYYTQIEAQIISILNNQNATDWCIVHSFKDEILQTFHQLNNQLVLGKLLVGRIPYLPLFIDHELRYGAPVFPKFIKEINIFHRLINKSLIEQTHKAEMQIFAWTVNQPKRAQQLIEMGIDGIITDYPNLFVENLDNYKKNDDKSF